MADDDSMVSVRVLDADDVPRRGWRFLWPDGEPPSTVIVAHGGETYRLEVARGDQ